MLTAPWSSRLLWDSSAADWSVPGWLWPGPSRDGSGLVEIPRQQTPLLLAGPGLAVHDELHVSEGNELQRHHSGVVQEAVLH